MGRVSAILNTMIARIKLFFIDRRREVVVFILFFLVSTISFSLGYLLAGRDAQATIVVEKVVDRPAP